MLRQRIRGVGVAAVLAVSFAAAAPARADVVTDWNTHATTALIATAGQSPPVSGIHLAMMHGAIYDAVNAIDARYQPYLQAPPARRWYRKRAAAATAAYRVLAGLLPMQQPALEAKYVAALESIPPGPAKDGGVAVGEAAAARMLAARANDGRFGSFRFPLGTSPGQWRPTPPAMVNDPNAWVGKVKPFLLRSSTELRVRAPHALDSPEYAAELAEVRSVGSLDSTVRTADQTDAARYWAGGPAPWIVAARQISEARRLHLVDNARLFAMLYLTGADAAIKCWEEKARWLYWWPVTAIREADTDGNPATEPDPTWTPLLSTPPYPEHPSGLMCFGGAFAETLRAFFGTDRVPFTVTSANSGTTRSFQRLSQARQEGVDARVWAGIHFRIADTEGANIGRQVSRYREEHHFQRRR